jgi:hypothetical protein
MAYTPYEPDYKAADISVILIDDVATGGVEFKAWMPIFALGITLLIILAIYKAVKR